MTAGSLRDRTMHWLQIAALIVVAVVLVRTITAPRALTSVAVTADVHADLSTTITHDSGTTADSSAVEARPVRRARQLQPGLIPHLAVLLLAALAAHGAIAQQRGVATSPDLTSRAVPVVGGRGPPLATA
ncbi:hypothetical protein [Actinospongicola halichondriae]|uniref:hypothetical protein n=1 Tax=Actinospongicola halichondriae TaxID=3236844 RepID=UPI003D39136D